MKLKQSEEQNFPKITVDDVLSKLQKVKKSGSGWTALCPVHDDHRSSFSVGRGEEDVPLLHCHACQASYEDVLRALGLWQETSPNKFNVVKEYDYVNEEGELIYQVVRLKPKGFAQRRMDKNGGWVYDLKGVVRLLYNLPNLIDATQIIVVEGEKDADRLNELGFVATTNSGGAGKWLKEYNKYFKNKDVVIIPDNDAVGFAHADEVAKNVFPTANEVKVVKLDGLSEKQDLYDWLNTHDSNELGALIQLTEPTVYEESELIFDDSMPSSIESEMAIIGSTLKNSSLITKIVDNEVIQDFYFPKHIKILKAMLECFKEREKVDYITVSERLKRSGNLTVIGGVEYLKELAEKAPDSINFDAWVKIVEGKSDLRKLVGMSKKISKTAYGELDDPNNFTQELGQELNKLRRKHRKEPFTRIFNVAEKFIDQVQSLNGDAVTGLPTGYVEIDEITSGLQKTDLFILAGRPSMGKTSLALNMATNVARKGFKVLVFSLEMSKEQLVSRLIASEARVNLKNLNSNNLDQHAWGRVANVLPDIEEWDIEIDDTPGVSVEEIRSKLIQYEEKFGCYPDLVVIDYIQLMSGNGRENRQQEVSQISRELKSIAKECGCVVLALSQLSRAPETRSNSRPIMPDLRESGSLEQDADVVAFVYRDEYYNKTDLNRGLAEFILAKQRNGPTGTIDLGFIGKFTKFENLFEARMKL